MGDFMRPLGGLSQKVTDKRQHRVRTFAVGDMTAVLQNMQQTSRAGHPRGDVLGMAAGTVFVAIPVQGQQRTANLGQLMIQSPPGKRIGQLGIDPGSQQVTVE